MKFDKNLCLRSKKKLCTTFKSDSGSAIVEFVALAIPLFIPIFIYLNHFSGVSVNQEIARSMAREVLRVYVISENESSARELSGKAATLFAQKWKLTDSESKSVRTQLDCTNSPCLSANGRIKLTLTFTDETTGRLISASAQEHLSPWLP
jgi:Flp pilus assembly protein TadG